MSLQECDYCTSPNVMNWVHQILLDSTAAVDTLDQNILLQRRQQTSGVNGIAHRCMVLVVSCRSAHYSSSPCSRVAHVAASAARCASWTAAVHFVHFDLIQLLEEHGMHHTCMPMTLTSAVHVALPTSACFRSRCHTLRGVASWMRLTGLHLNSSKTEVMWCATRWRQHFLPALELSVQPCRGVSSYLFIVGG